MKSIPTMAAVVVCGLLIGVAVIRLGCSGGQDSQERDASRVFVCEQCGEVTPFDPDFISAQFEAGSVKQGRSGPKFPCSACNKPGVRTVVLDFTAFEVTCSECGETVVDRPGSAVKALENGDAKLSAQGELIFRCEACGDFHGRMVQRNLAAEE